MLTAEQNERLTRVGPGTPMGDLMRRYWHPIAAISQFKTRHSQTVRLLGEDLVLYQDRSGTFGLIGSQCPHRKMSMIYGIPEERGLRCAYHGWVFGEDGACLEQPYEETEDPEGRFKEKVAIKSYPVEVLAGMAFAYLGPEPAPLLPRWDLFVKADVVRDIGYAEVPCNWLQIMENTLDPVHVEWLHQNFADFVAQQLEAPEKRTSRTPHVKIGFEEFEYGILKRRVVEGATEADEDWAVGHPMVFPNMLRQGLSRKGHRWQGFQIRVPIDDTHTAHWWYACYPDTGNQQRPEDYRFYRVPLPELDEEGQPRWDLLDNNSGQDMAAWVTQGPIMDRTTEVLGRSDKGIIMYRQMLEDNMRSVEDGGDPMNTFRDPDRNEHLELPNESDPLFARPLYDGQAAATKYSPVLAGPVSLE